MKVVAQDFVGNILGGYPIPFGKKMWIILEGKPYIWHIVERLKKCKKIDEIFFFAQDTDENKEAINLCNQWNLDLRLVGKSWNWKEDYFNWSKQLEAEIVIFNIPYFPLIDPKNLDSMIEYFISNKLDYLKSSEDTVRLIIINSNIFQRLYELEKDFEVFKVWTSIVEKRNDLFKIDNFSVLKEVKFLGKDYLKWPLLTRKIYKRFYRSPGIMDLNEVFSLYEKEPEWFEFLPESQLEIEVTNDCNLKCIMCSRTTKMDREIGYMDFELFKKVIDETESFGSVHFSGLGEPLLHPQIKEMFAYAKENAKEKRLEVGLWTNGLNLDEEISKEIIEKKLLDYIIFGLDAATREIYAKVKGIDAFDKAVGNITKFLELKKEILKDEPKYYGIRKPLIGVQIIKMKEIDKEIEKFMNEWDIQEKVKKMINYRSRVQKSESVDAELWETIYSKFLPVEHAIIGHFNNFCGQIEDRSVIDVTPLKRFPCKQLQSGISILWNGDIVLCRQDFDGEHPLGNLKGKSLTEILESEKLKNIWQARKDGEYDKLPLCKDCKEWYYNLYA